MRKLSDHKNYSALFVKFLLSVENPHFLLVFPNYNSTAIIYFSQSPSWNDVIVNVPGSRTNNEMGGGKIIDLRKY